MTNNSSSHHSRGGEARAKALSSAKRSEIAKKAAEARWSSPKAEFNGILSVGDMEIQCSVLPDGTRVLSQRGVGKALGRGYGGRDFKTGDGGGKLPFFIGAKTLIPFISKELMVMVESPIIYRHNQGGGVAHGIEASALPLICEVWLRARDAGALNKIQLTVATKAEILMRGLAHIGITALVDEATGYQEVRDKLALQAILDKFLSKEFAAWAKRFPDEFYLQMFRLRGWEFDPNSVARPGVVGKYTMDIVYDRLAPGIKDELEHVNPKNDKGNRKARHHQFLTQDVGHPALAQHLHAVIALMRASASWNQFKLMLDTSFPKRGDTLGLDV